MIIAGWLAALATASLYAALLSVPWAPLPRRFLRPVPAVLILLLVGGVAWFVFGAHASLFSPVVLALTFLLPLWASGFSALAGALAGNIVFASVDWWAPRLQLSVDGAVVFVAVGFGFAWWSQRPREMKWLTPWRALFGAALICLAAEAAMIPFGAPGAQAALWHHWGAYVSPALSLIGGGVPFRDFPVQYGLGPTLWIGLAAPHDLWLGVFFLTLTTNLIYLISLGAIVLIVTRGLPDNVRLLALAAEVVTVVAWTGYPPNFVGPMLTPSVGGARFGLLALLLLTIVWGEARKKPLNALEYGLWILALAWAPEAAVYSTIVMGPLTVLRALRGRRPETLLGALAVISARAGLFLLQFLASVAVLALAFRIGFGEWPSPGGYAVYLLNPPGEMLPTFEGPIWVLFAIGIVGLSALRDTASEKVATGLVCLLALTGASSYYFLGRSHDNNVLNVLPFCVPVLAHAMASDAIVFVRSFARLQMIGALAWSATFGFDFISHQPLDRTVDRLGPGQVLHMMDLTLAESAAALNATHNEAAPGPHAPIADIGAAIAFVKTRGEGPPLIDNQLYLMPFDLSGPVWTGMNNLANFDLLPLKIKKRFVRAGATDFHRPGWIVVDTLQPAEHFLPLFETSYTITDVETFGAARAYRVSPDWARPK